MMEKLIMLVIRGAIPDSYLHQKMICARDRFFSPLRVYGLVLVTVSNAPPICLVYHIRPYILDYTT